MLGRYLCQRVGGGRNRSLPRASLGGGGGRLGLKPVLAARSFVNGGGAAIWPVIFRWSKANFLSFFILRLLYPDRCRSFFRSRLVSFNFCACSGVKTGLTLRCLLGLGFKYFRYSVL